MEGVNPSDQDIFAFSDAFAEISGQVSLLEDAVGKALGELRILSSEVKYLEKEVNEFLKDYYARVGGLFEELRQIDLIIKNFSMEKKKNKQNKFASNNIFSINVEEQNSEDNDNEDSDILDPEVDNPFNELEFQNEIVDSELKRIYRNLVKICHPDMFPDDPYAREIFAVISSSYKNRDLGTMIRIEQTFLGKKRELNENSIEKLERLEKQYESVLQESDSLKIKKHQILNSPAHKLRHKVMWHKMCGDDIIERTIERVTVQIAEKREYLYSRYGIILPHYVVRDKRFALTN